MAAQLQYSGFEAKSVGVVLGCMCGDVLGSYVEGNSPTCIAEAYPEGLRDFHGNLLTKDSSESHVGKYTDDTQMTLALVKSLVRKGCVEAEDVSQQYAEDYQFWRGYAGGAASVLHRLNVKAADYRTTGRLVWKEGSYGNGGPMRIAPVGLAYRHASTDVLHQAVRDAVLCTHVHPQAIDGAFIQAAAVAYLATQGDANPHGLLSHLLGLARTKVMRGRLRSMVAAVDPKSPHNIVTHAPQGGAINWEYDIHSDAYKQDQELMAALGVSDFQIEATEAVCCALLALVRHWDYPECAVIAAVHYGGDTDTIGAMTGALVAARHGCSWIPQRWYDNLENGENGRDDAVALAKQLASLDVAESVHSTSEQTSPRSGEGILGVMRRFISGKSLS